MYMLQVYALVSGVVVSVVLVVALAILALKMAKDHARARQAMRRIVPVGYGVNDGRQNY